eukprot:5576441-Amphidinium_carterae.1
MKVTLQWQYACFFYVLLGDEHTCYLSHKATKVGSRGAAHYVQLAHLLHFCGRGLGFCSSACLAPRSVTGRVYSCLSAGHEPAVSMQAQCRGSSVIAVRCFVLAWLYA